MNAAASEPFTSSVWGIHDSRGGGDPGPSGCGYFRIVLPFDQLKANGWDVQYRAGRPPPGANGAKLVVGERMMDPAVIGEWRRLRQRHRLVYELDDDIWSVDPTNALAYRAFSILSIQDAIEVCCATSDLVTVTTEPLAEVIRRRTSQSEVRVIPNYLPGFVLEMERPRRERLTIGWAGGASHARDLASVAHAVRDVLYENSQTQLHLIGSDFRRTFGITSMARFTDWENEPSDFYKNIDFDIGLAPIIPSEFNYSKSPLKAMEYGALGIPVVASEFGAYREYVIDGVTGFLCRTEGQWRNRIRELVNDPDLRESMGAKGRELAAQHTIEKNWPRWASVYEEALS